jgi:hypothetical protein
MNKQMPLSTNEQKLQQYHEFFAIEYDFTLNIMPLDESDVTTFEHFIKKMPVPFKLASEMITIDQAALRPLQALSGVTGQLVDFLNHQSKKIDLLIGYILSQQDKEEHRYQGIKFGGGGVKFTAKIAFDLGQKLEIKMFLLENNCAIYCYGEVIEIIPDELITDGSLPGEVIQSNKSSSQQGQQYQHKVIFHFISENDREVLVRTSLHEQSKQLQKLSQLRNQAAEK